MAVDDGADLRKAPCFDRKERGVIAGA